MKRGRCAGWCAAGTSGEEEPLGTPARRFEGPTPLFTPPRGMCSHPRTEREKSWQLHLNAVVARPTSHLEAAFGSGAEAVLQRPDQSQPWIFLAPPPPLRVSSCTLRPKSSSKPLLL